MMIAIYVLFMAALMLSIPVFTVLGIIAIFQGDWLRVAGWFTSAAVAALFFKWLPIPESPDKW